MRTNEEYKNLEAERDALKLALDNSGNRHVYEAPEGMCFMPADTPDKLDALASRVAEMREALKYYANFGDDGVPVEDVAKAALAIPDDSAAILARRDAAIWLEAAKRL